MGEPWPSSHSPPPAAPPPRSCLTPRQAGRGATIAVPIAGCVPVPTMLRLLLLFVALGCRAECAAPLTFTMLQRTRVSKGSSEFSGNASLDGRLSHLLEGLNVTQVLPLEPPDAWARRREDVTNYLHYFSQLVKLFSKERPINYTQSLCCRLGCQLFPNGTACSFYECHLGAALARQRRSGRLCPAGADEIPHNHPGPPVFPQHHLCQHPAGAERRDRKTEQPVAHSTGAGSDPGDLGLAGHGRRDLLVHGGELLAEPAAIPCHLVGTGTDTPSPHGDRDQASITWWWQGMEPPSPGGSRDRPTITL